RRPGGDHPRRRPRGRARRARRDTTGSRAALAIRLGVTLAPPFRAWPEHDRNIARSARGRVELLRNLEHLFRRVLGRERRSHAVEVGDLAAVRDTLDHLEFPWGVTRQRGFAVAPDAGHRL